VGFKEVGIFKFGIFKVGFSFQQWDLKDTYSKEIDDALFVSASSSGI